MTTTMIFPNDSSRVRKSDPLASHEAADGNDITGSQREVMLLLGSSGPMTDFELVTAHDLDFAWNVDGWKNYTPQRLRTARAELVELGKVEATGIYRLTATGRRANVWALVEVTA